MEEEEEEEEEEGLPPLASMRGGPISLTDEPRMLLRMPSIAAPAASSPSFPLLLLLPGRPKCGPIPPLPGPIPLKSPRPLLSDGPEEESQPIGLAEGTAASSRTSAAVAAAGVAAANTPLLLLPILGIRGETQSGGTEVALGESGMGAGILDLLLPPLHPPPPNRGKEC